MERVVQNSTCLPKDLEARLMTRRLLYSIAVAVALVIGLSATPGYTQTASEEQSKPDTKSVAGKVISIGDSGTSFTLQVDGRKDTMKFVVNKNTEVQGQVKVGTLVAVDYQPTQSGANLALSVDVQG
jgi:hypothetical protein